MQIVSALKAVLKEGPVPLYYQLEQHLRERIVGGEFEPGASLPTEDAICSQYGVSRITVRRALSALQDDRLIERRRGVGSFVADIKGGMNNQLTGSLREFLAAAAALDTTPLSIQREPAPADVAKSLRVLAGEDVFRLKLVGSLEGQGPVAFLNIWVPLAVGTGFATSLRSEVPIVRQVEQALEAKLTRAEQFIEPDVAGAEAARHLGIAADRPILRVKRIYYAQPDTPIEVAYVRYHPERYRYAIDFKG